MLGGLGLNTGLCLSAFNLYYTTKLRFCQVIWSGGRLKVEGQRGWKDGQKGAEYNVIKLCYILSGVSSRVIIGWGWVGVMKAMRGAL
jgi:hypothetical protein